MSHMKATLYIIFAASILLSGCKPTNSSSFVSLFDGKTLKQWKGDTSLWTVENGAIVGLTTEENPLRANTFLFSDKEYDDFELHLKFQLKGGNSGVQFRSKNISPPQFVAQGYQADFDSSGKWVGVLYGERCGGVLALRGTKVKIAKDGKKTTLAKLPFADEIMAGIKKNDWNNYVIIARGPYIKLQINGKTTIEVYDEDHRERDLKGFIALQCHVGPAMKVQFKDILIKELKGQEALPPAEFMSSNNK